MLFISTISTGNTTNFETNKGKFKRNRNLMICSHKNNNNEIVIHMINKECNFFQFQI